MLMIVPAPRATKRGDVGQMRERGGYQKRRIGAQHARFAVK
jgi:hypothetical protein